MNDICIAPHSPLVFRGGKTWGATGGADHFPFPPPATIAGALRAAWGDQEHLDFALPVSPGHDIVRAVGCRGPLLCLLNDDGAIGTVYFPKPLDAVYAHDDVGGVLALTPQLARAPDDRGSNLPSGVRPLVLSGEMTGKPVEGDAFWTQYEMEQWLLRGATHTPPKKLGVRELAVDLRTHIAIGESGAVVDGALFQSAGLEFSRKKLEKLETFGMLVCFGEPLARAPRRIGGEGRSTTLLPRAGGEPSVFGGPQHPDLLAALRGTVPTQMFRVVLATPAIFSCGWRPEWIDKTTLIGHPPTSAAGVTVRLIAAAVDRWQAYSGWSLQTKQGHAVRRMAPAGSVYWFELVTGTGEDVAALWLQSICDADQDRLDGFGLVLPGSVNDVTAQI